jgi:L-xylulokinase
MSKYLLGIDNGGTVTKAAIYALDGKETAVASHRTKLDIPLPGYTERNMNDLWDANVKVIRDVISKSAIDPASIVGISVTGHGNGLYLIDDNGRPSYNSIYSTDTRANQIVEKWSQDGTFKRVHPMIMQAIWAGQPIALLSWIKTNNPDILKQTRWILMCKDYIRFCLTGEVYAEITDLSGTNLFNQRDLKYDVRLLKEFGLEDLIEKLPPVKYSSEICGYITKDVARLTGLKEGTPVAGGLFDIDACAIATGVIDEDKMSIVAGTWSINQYITKTPIISEDLFLNTIYCMKGYRLITEASPTSASNLEWFVEQFFGEEEKKAAENGCFAYDVCNEMVSKIEQEESNIIFLPFLFGTNVSPDSKSAFIGLKGWHTKYHVLKAVYEGIVFSHRYHIERLLSFRKKPESILISGGAARSKVWVQIFANVLQIPIEVVKGSELGSLGAAICAGVAVGCYESFESAVKKMVEISYICSPDPGKKEMYDRKYFAYRNILTQLEPVWKFL